MSKIPFEHFQKMMLFNVVENNTCIEIAFCIDNSQEYYNCWLGKCPDRDTKEERYWYGLAESGSQAYYYNTFAAFANSNIFHGKNIKEIWNSISFMSIDGCSVEERLPFYL